MTQEGARIPTLPPRLKERFEPISVLGSGGFGVVLRARQVALERDVALKILHAAFADDATVSERFAQEARLVARLADPTIVPVLDFGIEEGIAYIAFAFVEGHSLREEIDRQPIPWPRAIRHAHRIARALVCIHRASIVHRDLKPDNVLIPKETGHAVVTDFGVSRVGEPSVRTKTGVILGTPGYMAPEYARGGPPTVAADIYALGVICWEMLAGFRPLQRRDPRDAASERSAVEEAIEAMRSSPVAIDSVVPGLPIELSILISRMLCREAQDRPATAEEIVRALEVIAREGPSTARAGSSIRQPAVPPGTHQPTARSLRTREPSVDRSQPARQGKPGRLVVRLGVAAAVLTCGLAAALARWAAPPPPPPIDEPRSPEPRSPRPSAVTMPPEVTAFHRLLGRERRQVNLRLWDRSAEAPAVDCPFILREVPPDGSIQITVPKGHSIVTINDAEWPIRPELSPLRQGVNWVRVKVRSTGEIPCTATIPCERLRSRAPAAAESERELEGYERVRAALYRETGGRSLGQARNELQEVMPDPTHPFRRVAEAWIDLSPDLTRILGSAEGVIATALVSGNPFTSPEVLKIRRRYLDQLESTIVAYPDRWYLWTGIAWQLRWADQPEAAIAAFIAAIELAPRCSWPWFELARWEYLLWKEGRASLLARPERELVEDAAAHFALAESFMTQRTMTLDPSVVREVKQCLEVMRREAARGRR